MKGRKNKQASKEESIGVFKVRTTSRVQKKETEGEEKKHALTSKIRL